MNKLVIIGNGFDLAHGMKTSYADFLLWEVNEAFKQNSILKSSNYYIISSIFTLESNYDICRYSSQEPYQFDNIADFLKFIEDNKVGRQIIKITYSFKFIETIIKSANQNWVDIEKEYFKELVKIQTANINEESRNKMLINLNEGVDLIRKELCKYLELITKNKLEINYEISLHFRNIFSDYDIDKQYENPTMFLNFNYTDTIMKYINEFTNPSISINYIHGKLNDIKNPIIFGYGDETDKKYKELEDLENNEYLKHMKSFAYLQTPNYRKLFNFLDTGAFEIHIMGHSCGVSDRLLFKHIVEHQNFNSIQLYFHQKSETENDFFEKTKNLTRYFDLDTKHKMRTKLISFNESKPLIPYKS